MWKLRAGLVCVVNSSIFDSSLFDFAFLFPFFRVQIAIVDISMATRDTRSAVEERAIIIIILISTSATGMYFLTSESKSVLTDVVLRLVVDDWISSPPRDPVVLTFVTEVVETNSFDVVDVTLSSVGVVVLSIAAVVDAASFPVLTGAMLVVVV